MRLVRSRLLLVLGLILTASFVACGDDEDTIEAGDPSPTTRASSDTGGAGGNTVTATAMDIKWEDTELTAPVGAVELELVNHGQILHTFLIEGREDDLKLEAQSNGTDSGTIDLEAGEYTFYCDVPGHRAAGMEGTLTVS